MNLEELLRAEREVVEPNPLVDRTDALVSRVRRRRRVVASVSGVVAVAALAITVLVLGQTLPHEVAPAEPSPSPTLALGVEDAPVEPGLYAFPVFDAPAGYRVPVVPVPAGFLSAEEGVRSGDMDAGDGRVLLLWDIDSVYTHPCAAGATAVRVGPTAGDLAEALAAQPMRSGTDPVPVTVDGFDGFYVELSVPDIDLSACPGGKFNSWPGRWQQAPGQVDMLWILDVDGQRVVFDASRSGNLDPQAEAELKDMVTSTTFAPAG